MNKPIKLWASDEKPREKLLSKGRESLSNAELLGILLATGTKSKSAVDLGREIMTLAQNNLNSLARFTLSDYKKISGIGTAKAMTIFAAIELGSRRNFCEALRQKVTSSKQASEILQPIMGDKHYEEFWILALNQAGVVLSSQKVSEGGMTGTVVDIRRIFKLALELNACSLILAHNHPSGNTNPSEADKRITQNLKEAGIVMDIQVKDHLIICNNGYYSFADSGLM